MLANTLPYILQIFTLFWYFSKINPLLKRHLEKALNIRIKEGFRGTWVITTEMSLWKKVGFYSLIIPIYIVVMIAVLVPAAFLWVEFTHLITRT